MSALKDLWPRSDAARATLLIIVAFLIPRLIGAAVVGLGMDESYSLAVAQDLRLSYFDHPPMHQWIIHAFEPVLGLGRFSRLPFIALFAGTSWMMFTLARRLFGEVAGVWAVIALSLSPFFTVVAAGWVLPDGPLLFSILAASNVLARLFFPAAGEAERPWRDWLEAGFWIGLATLSKYQGVFFGLGVAAFVLSRAETRAWLRHPAPYVAAILAVAVFSPALIWNAQHHWASFTFQGGRGAPGGKFHPEGPLTALLGQMVVMGPWVFVPMVMAGWGAVRAGRSEPRTWLCLCAAAPAILVFTLTPLFGPKGLPHWSMPGWIMLFPVLGGFLARREGVRRWPQRWAIISAAVLLLIWGAFASEVATGWIGSSFPKAFKRGDPTVESIEWNQLGPELVRRGLIEPGGFVVSAEWMEAGKLELALKTVAPVVIFAPDARQFAYHAGSNAYVGHNALIIGRPNNVTEQLPAIRSYFQAVTPLPSVWVGRGGRRETELVVYQATRLIRPYPVR